MSFSVKVLRDYWEKNIVYALFEITDANSNVQLSSFSLNYLFL